MVRSSSSQKGTIPYWQLPPPPPSPATHPFICPGDRTLTLATPPPPPSPLPLFQNTKKIYHSNRGREFLSFRRSSRVQKLLLTMMGVQQLSPSLPHYPPRPLPLLLASGHNFFPPNTAFPVSSYSQTRLILVTFHTNNTSLIDFRLMSPLPNQQRTLNKLPTELQCRTFVNKHRLSLQIWCQTCKRMCLHAMCSTILQLNFHFAYHRWWLG